MKKAFADTSYLIAKTSPGDKHHSVAVNIVSNLGNIHLFTTEEVLIEYLNHFSAFGPHIRLAAVDVVKSIVNNPQITILSRSHASFAQGLQLYERRLDKGYSLTDCISMNCMRAHGIVEILTTDRHFQQEGFVILLNA